MIEIIPSLIELFGAISGIIIAFLVLLFGAVKKWIDRSKKDLLFEVDNYLKCPHTIRHPELKPDKELIESLKTNHFHQIINKNKIENVIGHLENKVIELNKNIEGQTKEVAGTNAQNALHLKNYHLDDIQNALDHYTSANKFFNNLPVLSMLSVGIPLLVTAYYLILKYKQLPITNWMLENHFNIETWILIPALAVLIFVFGMSAYAFINLKQINLESYLSHKEVEKE